MYVIYHKKYGLDGTKIKFIINSNEKESDFAPWDNRVLNRLTD
jgi:hypothetical protein